MKKVILFICISLLFICNSCEKKDDENTTLTPLEQLPPKTQIGANTAGCLVDGLAVFPRGSFSSTYNLFYINQKDFSLRFTHINNGISRTIHISSINYELKEGEIYQLIDYGSQNKFGEFVISFPNLSRKMYQTTSLTDGELKITHHSYNNATISGEFWFDAIDNNGNKVEVREGRFDFKY